MTAPTDCARLHELASELALGLADGEDRAWALDHLSRCPDCRRRVDDLAATADELLALAPPGEPPPGFEAGVLAAMRPSAASRRRPALALAAAALASALLGAGAVWLALSDDRDLASAYRETLEVADGEYLDAVPLEAVGGRRIGEVFGYQGETPWVLVIVAAAERGDGAALPAGRYEAELIRAGGARVSLPPLEVGPEAATTASAIPVAYHELRELRLVDPDGKEIAEAELGQHG